MSTTAQLSENSHRGFDGLKAGLCLGSMHANSNTASGMQLRLRPNGIGSRSSGKERDEETGLDYFGARYYSGAQGRFTSTDPIFHPAQSRNSFNQFLSQPDRWNKYIYAGNNPLKYIDLAGLEKYLAILVDQPLPGKNVAYNDYGRPVPEVGHVSVGLINTDNGKSVIRGFYPENVDEMGLKTGWSQPGVIRDDTNRMKKVDAAFFFEISDEIFQKLKFKLINDSDRTQTPKFDLKNFNCTDYAIQFVRQAGIQQPDPQGAIGPNAKYGWASNPNMYGNAMMEESLILGQKIEADKIRELKKLLGIKK